MHWRCTAENCQFDMHWAVFLVAMYLIVTIVGYLTQPKPRTNMRNSDYQGPGKYDVRLTVDEVSFVVTVDTKHRQNATTDVCAWAERNFRERLYGDIHAEVIGPHQE